jgi:nitrile hydratase accessory protein
MNLPSQPIEENEPVFQAPWEARAFAMVNHLATSQHFNWSEWTDYLVQEIAATEQAAPGSKTYYENWMDAYSLPSVELDKLIGSDP